MTFPRRDTLLAAAIALWALAVAISLIGFWDRPAPPGQLPGYATQHGFDAQGPFRWVVGMIVLPLAAAWSSRPLIRRLATKQTWAVNAVLAAAPLSIWYVVIAREPLWVALPFVVTVIVALLLGDKELAFTRRDWILLPVFSTAFMAVVDLAPKMPFQRAAIIALAVVCMMRMAVCFLHTPLAPAYAFLLAPLGLLAQTSFLARDQRYAGWPALAIVIITPFVMRLVLRNERRALIALTFVIYPLVAYAYSNATSPLAAEGRPRVYFFEDSHSLPLASEYLRGELPYRDQFPGHGLLEDGLFDYLAFRLRDVSLGSALHSRQVVSFLNGVAIYFLGFAMTGSPEVGLATYAFWQYATPPYPIIRVTPALFALIFVVLAVRRRNTRWLIPAGFCAVLSGVMSLDYAFYTAAVLGVAVLRFRPGFLRAVRDAAIGTAIGVVPLFGTFAVFGILDDFFRTTFIEVTQATAAYKLSFFRPPASVGNAPLFPELLPAWFSYDALPHLTWCAVVIATAVLLTKRRSARTEVFIVVGLWTMLAGLAYGYRFHQYFRITLAAMLIPAAWYAIRRRFVLAPAFVIALVIASMPTAQLSNVEWRRRARGPLDAGWVEVHDVPRARGALLMQGEAEQLASAKKYVSLALKEDETFFDFSNRAILFYLLRRDNPVRFHETAHYEPEHRQREVIAALEANPNVRAALIPVPTGGVVIDNISNTERAPLVWQYLQQNFEPDFSEGQVHFWRRK